MICQAINLSGLATVSWVAGEDVRPGTVTVTVTVIVITLPLCHYFASDCCL